MIKEVWRKNEILPVLFTMMICSVTCLSLGVTSLALNSKKNYTDEINQYIPERRRKIITPKISLRSEKYDQSLKINKRKQRYRRHVMQMARMLKCMSGCNPLSYRGYGCFCGYLGSGQPVDDIDRCCLQHDFCYSFISCPQSLIYFVPYTWQCMNPGAAHCGLASVPGVSQKCATQLCECDREFARCVSNYPCPRKKPGCTANNFVLLQAITKNEI